MAFNFDLAPAGCAFAFQQTTDHAGFRLGCGGAVAIGVSAQRAPGSENDEIAFAAEHGLMNPALGSLPVADFAPSAKLGNDFGWQALSLVDPFDWILDAGSGSHVDLISPEADKARQRQAGIAGLCRNVVGGP